MKYIYSLLSATILATNIANAATAIDGWYGSLFGGYSYLPDNVSNTTSGVLRDDTKYHEGYHAGIRFGYQSYPLRYEGEFTYIQAEPRHFKINNITQTDVEGDSTASLIMANLYYDLPEFVPAFEPFLGVGLGYGYVTAQLNGFGPLGYTRFKATDDVIVYQATTGLSYHFAETWSANLAYRYVATDRADFMGKVFQAHLASAAIVFRFDGPVYK